MKILSVNTYHVRAPLENPFGFSQFYYAQRENLLVEVVAEDGTSGWGECYGPAGPVKAAIHTCLLPLVIGQDCLHHELIWHKIWQRFMDYGRYGSMIAALSGIDIALWDLKGKLLEQPLHCLLGGTEYDSMPLYATGHYFRQGGEGEMIQIISDEAAHHVELGFKALKMKIGKNEAFDRRVIETVRQRFPDLTLMADANHAYNPNEALRMGRVLEANGYIFFEEPVAPHAYEHFAFLRAKLDVAIATGECEQTRFGFRRLLESGGVDILQPDLAHCGGISEGLKIRALANAFGVDVTPHAWGTWIGFAAALHFHAVCPHNPGRYEIQPLYLECDNSENPFKDRAFTEKILIKDGRAHLPQGLGLGVQVDKDALDEFIVTQ